MTLKVKIAFLLNRVLTHDTCNSNTKPKWTQSGRWHVKMCVLCTADIANIPIKKGWAGAFGIKENFVLCPNCYDTYDIIKR